MHIVLVRVARFWRCLPLLNIMNLDGTRLAVLRVPEMHLKNVAAVSLQKSWLMTQKNTKQTIIWAVYCRNSFHSDTPANRIAVQTAWDGEPWDWQDVNTDDSPISWAVISVSWVLSVLDGVEWKHSSSYINVSQQGLQTVSCQLSGALGSSAVKVKLQNH